MKDRAVIVFPADCADLSERTADMLGGQLQKGAAGPQVIAPLDRFRMMLDEVAGGDPFG